MTYKWPINISSYNIYYYDIIIRYNYNLLFLFIIDLNLLGGVIILLYLIAHILVIWHVKYTYVYIMSVLYDILWVTYHAIQIPIDAPWNAPKAAEWDAMTMRQFIDKISWTRSAIHNYKLYYRFIIIIII